MGCYSLVATQSITLPMSNIPISITLSELSLDKGTPPCEGHTPLVRYTYTSSYTDQGFGLECVEDEIISHLLHIAVPAFF